MKQSSYRYFWFSLVIVFVQCQAKNGLHPTFKPTEKALNFFMDSLVDKKGLDNSFRVLFFEQNELNQFLEAQYYTSGRSCRLSDTYSDDVLPGKRDEAYESYIKANTKKSFVPQELNLHQNVLKLSIAQFKNEKRSGFYIAVRQPIIASDESIVELRLIKNGPDETNYDIHIIFDKDDNIIDWRFAQVSYFNEAPDC